MCSAVVMRYVLLLFVLLPAARAADSCYPTRLAGPYAFLLSGETTISGTAQSTVSLGRITFDDGGRVSGTSSIKFAGYLLGNPVKGTYEAKSDCTVTWQLQDDSGAYQHFAGRYTPDGSRVQFRQTDPGGVRGGVMTEDGRLLRSVGPQEAIQLLGIRQHHPDESRRNRAQRRRQRSDRHHPRR